MRFKVSKIADIMCDGCGGSTRVVPNKIYNTDDLACNCPDDGELFGREDKAALTDKVVDTEPKPNHNSKVAKANNREKESQAKMFEEEPENVFQEETMTREEVAGYLKTLVWQELLNSAKNNGVKKQPKTNRDQLELDILDAVFGDADVVITEISGDDDEQLPTVS